MDNETSTNVNPSQTLVLSPSSPGDSIQVQKTKLLAISGPLQGKEFFIDRDVFTIGSGEHNDLVISDSTVSKRHCEIGIDEQGYRVKDLDSTNGTFVQGVRVRTAFLNNGTEFKLGKTRLIFCPLQESHTVPLSSSDNFGQVLGHSVAMRRVFHTAETYAPTDATIMITGETGTGKEILAEEIHNKSDRKDKPFIVIDCASLARELIESELFGHTKGAFTGANADRVGAFEHANGGTVFLDEIGDLSPELQPKLLRVLEKREVRRVGSNKLKDIDVRIICATNRNLDIEVNEGRFREDLFFRLSVVRIELPPLRHRKEDITLLAKCFICELHGENAMDEIAEFDEAIDMLKRHDWPGNVRELRNLMEAAFYTQKRPIELTTLLSLGHLRSLKEKHDNSFETDRPFKDAKNDLIADFEKTYIRDLLDRNNGNVSQSAREAGIERAYLQRLIRKYGLKS